MLIVPDKNDLGDKRLDGHETVAKLTEDCLKMASSRKIEGQEELEDEERASGPRLQFTEILSRIRAVCPQLKVLEGSPGNVALYYPRTNQELTETDPLPNRDAFFFYHKYVGGMPKVELPEYGYVLTDTSHLATKEAIRGWRTVLIGLIKAKVLTYKQAVQQFGEATGRRSNRWHEQLRYHKN